MPRQYISNIILCVFVISHVTAYLHDCDPYNGYPHKIIRLDEPFEFRCEVHHEVYHSNVGSKNCILTHRDGDTNKTITCVSNENATPCLDDHRIIIENL